MLLNEETLKKKKKTKELVETTGKKVRTLLDLRPIVMVSYTQ